MSAVYIFHLFSNGGARHMRVFEPLDTFTRVYLCGQGLGALATIQSESKPPLKGLFLWR